MGPQYAIGKTGLIPINRAAKIEVWKREHRKKRERLALHRLTKAYWWGFDKNRRTKQIVRSKKMPNGSDYSRGFFLDAYGARLADNAEDLQFALRYFHPCKGEKAYVRAARTA